MAPVLPLPIQAKGNMKPPPLRRWEFDLWAKNVGVVHSGTKKTNDYLNWFERVIVAKSTSMANY